MPFGFGSTAAHEGNDLEDIAVFDFQRGTLITPDDHPIALDRHSIQRKLEQIQEIVDRGVRRNGLRGAVDGDLKVGYGAAPVGFTAQRAGFDAARDARYARTSWSSERSSMTVLSS
jgi:hypothetical protein